MPHNLPCSNLSQLSTLCGATSRPSLVLPLKTGKTLTEPEGKRKRHGNNTCLSKKLYLKGNFLQLHENYLHAENWKVWRLMETFPLEHQATCPCSVHSIHWANTSATAQVVQQKLRPSQPQTWLRKRWHLLPSAHTVLSKRQTRGITGAQTIIMKMSSGHMSCIGTHRAI